MEVANSCVVVIPEVTSSGVAVAVEEAVMMKESLVWWWPLGRNGE